ncbi:MAG: glycosyltransferase family 39 protein [Candidatus Promineifilaceae bacterium]
MRRYRFLTAAILILVLAAALRFHLIETQSFWNDEGNSARLSERSVVLIIEGTASDIHPPLYYLVLRGWREFLGESELALRAFSAFAGVCLVGVTIALGRRLIGPRAYGPALAAGIFVAINPALIYYSQETRMYELLAFLAILSTLLLVMWLQGGCKKIGLAAAYVLSVVAGLYTHYFFPAVLVTQNLIFLIWIFNQRRSRDDQQRDKPLPIPVAKPLGRWIGMMAAAFLLYLPWMPVYWQQAGDRQPFRYPLPEFLFDGLRWSALGSTIEEPVARWLLPVFLVLAVLGVWFGRHRTIRGVPYTPTLLLSIFIPLFLMWLLGATQPAFFKFTLVVIPPISLLAGPGWWWSWRWTFSGSDSKNRRGAQSGSSLATPNENTTQRHSANVLRRLARVFILVLAVVVLVGSGRALINMYYDSTYARADYRGIVAQIASETHPNAGIVLNAANQWEVFTYYHQEGAPVYPVPKGYPDPAIIEGELSQIAGQHSRIYAVFWGEAERDPQRLVERWLDANAFKARDEWRGDVRFVTYSLPSSLNELKELESDGISSLRFGDTIQLERVMLSGDDPQPGDIVQISLFWMAGDHIDQRYKVFLHLVDENGQIVAQRDSEPGGGLALTTTWTPGEMIVDNHGLLVPIGTKPGQYTLLLGMYDLSDPLARLPISSVDGDFDAFPLATIIIGGTEG